MSVAEWSRQALEVLLVELAAVAGTGAPGPTEQRAPLRE